MAGHRSESTVMNMPSRRSDIALLLPICVRIEPNLVLRFFPRARLRIAYKSRARSLLQEEGQDRQNNCCTITVCILSRPADNFASVKVDVLEGA